MNFIIQLTILFDVLVIRLTFEIDILYFCNMMDEIME